VLWAVSGKPNHMPHTKLDSDDKRNIAETVVPVVLRLRNWIGSPDAATTPRIISISNGISNGVSNTRCVADQFDIRSEPCNGVIWRAFFEERGFGEGSTRFNSSAKSASNSANCVSPGRASGWNNISRDEFQAVLKRKRLLLKVRALACVPHIPLLLPLLKTLKHTFAFQWCVECVSGPARRILAETCQSVVPMRVYGTLFV